MRARDLVALTALGSKRWGHAEGDLVLIRGTWHELYGSGWIEEPHPTYEVVFVDTWSVAAWLDADDLVFMCSLTPAEVKSLKEDGEGRKSARGNAAVAIAAGTLTWGALKVMLNSDTRRRERASRVSPSMTQPSREGE